MIHSIIDLNDAFVFSPFYEQVQRLFAIEWQDLKTKVTFQYC